MKTGPKLLKKLLSQSECPLIFQNIAFIIPTYNIIFCSSNDKDNSRLLRLPEREDTAESLLARTVTYHL
jgi:hypothetical protein